MILQSSDDLRSAALDPGARPAWERRTKQITDERFDTLFRVIVSHELSEHGPTWAADTRLEQDWIVPDPFRDNDTIRAQTPSWLATAGIYLAERGLTTA
jgi:hypothetical protein